MSVSVKRNCFTPPSFSMTVTPASPSAGLAPDAVCGATDGRAVHFEDDVAGLKLALRRTARNDATDDDLTGATLGRTDLDAEALRRARAVGRTVGNAHRLVLQLVEREIHVFAL